MFAVKKWICDKREKKNLIIKAPLKTRNKLEEDNTKQGFKGRFSCY